VFGVFGLIDDFEATHKFHAIRVSGVFHVVTMFLGGSYHDRDNPHMWGVSQGQFIVFITIGCNQKEGRQQSSSRRGLRTSMETIMMMMMTTMTIFYRGTGTKCTENQILLVTRYPITVMADDGRQRTMNNKSHNNNNITSTTTTTDGRRRRMLPGASTSTTEGRSTSSNSDTDNADDDHEADDDEDANGYTTNRTTNTNTNKHEDHDEDDADDAADEAADEAADDPRRRQTKDSTDDDRWMSPRKQLRMDQSESEDDDDGDDGDHTACDWYTRQKNQPSLTSSMPLQQQPPTTEDARSLANNNKGKHQDSEQHQQRDEDEDDVDGGEIPSATGTLDRKTSQASPATCLYNNQHQTREEA
jgi:hypothetical protein